MDPSIEFKNISDESVSFEGLKISDKWKLLASIDERSSCPKCNKSRKYFCYTCYVPVAEIQEHIPKLPVKIDIIKHAKEIDGKSTAAHAAVLAPDDVQIFTYPCIPDYKPNDNVVLIYPHKDAYSVNDVIKIFSKKNKKNNKSDTEEPVCKKHCVNGSITNDTNSGSSNNLNQQSIETRKRSDIISRAVFIDATWNQSKGIYRDSRLRGLPCVVLKSRISNFWRHQKGSPRWYLATIEAIHQFLIELHMILSSSQHDFDNIHETQYEIASSINQNKNELNILQNNCNNSSSNCNNNHNSNCFNDQANSNDNNYNGEYDNLLFLFRFMYSKIHMLYNHDSLLSYKRPLE
ncbi:tRNA-uridine aminocarboxypropyltransferase 1 isoform X2 [Lycorma delicatula]|uniref:tRNA-uridine aminocarboxypropyltransferase 1 isoform X2 n=1 Tax=Lycorma delicatula TaxID=130591 RepID=UPI003F511987